MTVDRLPVCARLRTAKQFEVIAYFCICIANDVERLHVYKEYEMWWGIVFE